MEIQNQTKRAGRPSLLPPDAAKATITFYNNQIAFLDHLSADIRQNTFAIIDRGSIIRALVGALQDSKIDLSQLRTEKAIRDALTTKLNVKNEKVDVK